MKTMNIQGRKKKTESRKKIQIIKMYLILLDYGSVYDFELGLDCSKEKDRTTFRRYARELETVKAIPKVRLKTKTIGTKTFRYYDAPDVRLVRKRLPGPFVAENKYHRFRFGKDPKQKRLARILLMAYWGRTWPCSGMNDPRKRYEIVNPGASGKTYRRDHDLLMYAIFSYMGHEKEDLSDPYLHRYLLKKDA